MVSIPVTEASNLEAGDMPKPIVGWFEITGRTYRGSTLFGWSVNDAGDGSGYRLVEAGEKGIAGGVGAFFFFFLRSIPARTRTAQTSVGQPAPRVDVGSLRSRPARPHRAHLNAMATFVFRLLSPRPAFALDTSDEERVIMARHAAHWKRTSTRGRWSSSVRSSTAQALGVSA